MDWESILIKWCNCMFEDNKLTSKIELTGAVLFRILKIVATEIPFTEDADEDCYAKTVVKFIKAQYPKYFGDTDPDSILDKEEIVNLLSLLLFYCCMEGNSECLQELKAKMCNDLNIEEQIKVKSFIEKLVSEDVTSTAVRQAIEKNGSPMSCQQLQTFSYTPKSNKRERANNTPLKELFESPLTFHQKRLSLENQEIKKLKSELDLAKSENSELIADLAAAEAAILDLNEKLTAQIRETRKLHEENAFMMEEMKHDKEQNIVSVSENKLKQEIKVLEKYVTELEEKLAAEEDERESYEKRAKRLEEETRCLQKRLDECLADLKISHEKVIIGQEEIDYLKKQIKDLSDVCENQRCEVETNVEPDSLRCVVTDIPENLGKAVIDVQLHEQKEENENLKCELEEKVKELQSTRMKLDSEIKKVQEIKFENEQFVKKIEEMKWSLNSKEEEKQSINEKLKLCELNLMEANESLAVSQSQQSELLKKCSEVMEMKVNMEKNLCEIQREKENLKLEVERNLIKLKELENELLVKEKENHYLSDELNTCKLSLFKSEERLKSLQSNVVELQSNYSKVTEMKFELEQEIFQTNKEKENLKLEISSSRVQLEKVTNDFLEKEKENNSLVEELNTCKSKLCEIEEDRKSLQSDMLELERNYNKIMKMKVELEKEILNTRNENDNLKHLVSTSQIKMEQLKNELLVKEKEKNSLLDDLNACNSNLIETKESLKSLQSKTIELEMKYCDVTEIKVELERELSETKEERDYLKIELSKGQEELKEQQCNLFKTEKSLSYLQTEMDLISSMYSLFKKDFMDFQKKLFSLLPSTGCDALGPKEDWENISALENDSSVVSGKLELFNSVLNFVYEHILKLYAQFRTLEGNFSRLQLDNKELEEENKVLAKHNNTLIADKAELHEQLMTSKWREETIKKLEGEIKKCEANVETLKQQNCKLNKDMEAIDIINKSLNDRCSEMNKELTVLHTQNKHLSLYLTGIKTIYEKLCQIVDKNYETELKLEIIISIKHHLANRLLDLYKSLQNIDTSYRAVMCELPLTGDIMTMRRDLEAQVVCIQEEFQKLSRETVDILHVCVVQMEKDFNYCRDINSRLKFGSMEQEQSSHHAEILLTEIQNDWKSSKLPVHNHLLDINLPTIESQINYLISEVEKGVNKCAALENECKNAVDNKQKTLCGYSTGRCPVGKLAVAADEDNLNLDDSLDAKVNIKTNSVLNPIENNQEMTPNFPQLKITELNKQLFSLKLSLSSAESRIHALTDELSQTNTANEQLCSERDAALGLNNKLEGQLRKVEMEVRKSHNELCVLRENNNQLKTENSLLKKRISDKEAEGSKYKSILQKSQAEMEAKIQNKVSEVREEYEQKLATLKGKMKEAFYQEKAKLQQNVCHQNQDCSQKISFYEKKIVMLKSELQDVREKLMLEHQERKSLEEQLHKLKAASDPSKLLCDTGNKSNYGNNDRAVQDSDNFLLPRSRNHQWSSTGVVDENITFVRRQIIHKSVPAGMGKVFHEEDEEGEVFSNTYLADLKAGRCRVPGIDGKERISELQFRNSLCPPHLKSSYPTETLMNDKTLVEDDIKMNYNKPGPPTPGKNGRPSVLGSDVTCTPRSILKEINESTLSRKTTPSRIKALFTSRTTRRDENAPMTPRSRSLSLFRKSSRTQHL